MEIVFPGQNINNLIEEKVGNDQGATIKVHLGPGIIQNGSKVVPLRAGALQNLKKGTKFVLNAPQNRYIPLQNDLVIGIITARLSEFFRVDIGSQTTAILSVLNGFEGSTKKNRPNWNVGTVIFARVSMAHPDLEPELACFDPSGNISTDLFGELGAAEGVVLSENSKAKNSEKTSTLLRTSCDFSRKLQNPLKNTLISILGRYFAFEIASGANGRIFLEAGNPREVAVIHKLILDIHKLNISESAIIEEMIRNVANSLGKHKKK